jgi:hypothetical protein
LGCDIERQATRLAYWRYDKSAGWVRASLDELLSADDGHLVTTIFVHGNRMARAEAFTRGWAAYRALVQTADERPVRFIVWSWPSEQIRGPIQDVRIKAQRTNPAGCYLAWFLNRLPASTPLSLWGHSFGARVVTGAMHVLGGGSLIGFRLDAPQGPKREHVSLVLITAALDSHWLAPGRFHGQALSRVGHLLLVNNGCDRLLKRYHWLYHRKACAVALGYTGLSRHLVATDGCRIEQVNACCQVGPEHSLVNYLCSRGLMARMRRALLPGSPSPSANPVAAEADAPSAEARQAALATAD